MSKTAHPQSIAEASIIAEHYNRVAGAQGIGSRESRMDADETNLLALMLEQMRTRVYEDEYPELKSRRFLPVSNEVDTGAESFAYEETNHVGEAKIITNYADDPPSVETESRKVTHSIVSIGDSYHYSIQDIRRAAFSGQPLTARKALAARRLWERKLDAVAALGDADSGIGEGCLNNSSVGIEPLAAAGAWSSKTAQAILDDLNALMLSMVVTSKELYQPNSLLLPTAQFMKISQTRMATDTSETVLEAFMRANPFIRSVDSWNLLSGAGVGSLDRAMAYVRDPEVLELQIPQEFEVLPPQPKNFAFSVLCHGRTAGTAVFRPLGLRYMDGI